MSTTGQGSSPQAISPAASVAQVMANTIPLVHHPASARFPEWRRWGALKSSVARGDPPGSSPAEQLRRKHVFTYAGPSCYTKATAVGDAAVYFAPSVDASASGSATAFDSGALVEPNPCLQPWAGLSESERWARFQQDEVPLIEWRARFSEWLARCYDDPTRYLDSHGDSASDGCPDRPEPAELTEHNGVKGKARYRRCADRRAWTWEVRVADEIRFEHACVLHVPFDHLDKAQDLADEIERVSRRRVEVKTLPRGVPSSAEAIYRDSGRVLREVIGR